jgi:type VI secretion system protein VasG
MCADPDLMPEPDALSGALRQPLLEVFPPALLGRLLVVPYYPLSDEMLGQIVRLQLKRIQRRLERITALFLSLTTAWWNRLFSAAPR